MEFIEDKGHGIELRHLVGDEEASLAWVLSQSEGMFILNCGAHAVSVNCLLKTLYDCAENIV